MTLSCERKMLGRRRELTVEDMYHIGETVGEGQFGKVKLAGSLDDGSLFVCKTIKKAPAAQLKQQEMEIKAEISGMRLVGKHNNTVTLFESYEDSKAHHLIMEYCRDGDLFDFINKREKLAEGLAAQLVTQLAKALHHCHSLGLVHRDLKPENVFISGYTSDSLGRKVPNLKLGDFGSSVVLKPNEQICQIAGTLNYAAPEVVRNEWYSSEIDIWSLGVILYVMLTGYFPFYGDTKKETYEAILTRRLRFSSKSWQLISPDAVDLLRWMLERDPKKRATALDVLNHNWIKKHNCATHSMVSSPKSTLCFPYDFEDDEDIPIAMPVYRSVRRMSTRFRPL